MFQVPINSDQLVNVKEAVKANIGLSVPWTELSEEKFGLAVKEVSPYHIIIILPFGNLQISAIDLSNPPEKNA